MIAKFKYHILLHLIIFMWGFTGILGKLIHLEAFYIVWHRVLIASVALAIGMAFLGKSFRVSSSKQLIKICFIGIIVGLHWVTFYKSIQLSTASLGILCLSTTTIHVAWLEPIVMKRPFSLIQLLMSIVVIYGIYFVSGNFNEQQFEALFYGLLSALLAATFSVFNAKFAKDDKPSTITLYEMITATLFLSVVLFFQGNLTASLFSMTISDLLWLLFLGILCTSFAFLATIEVMKHLGAFTVSLSVNLEPVYTILLAIFILNENELLGSDFYIGASIIVLVVILNGFISPIQKQKAIKQQQKENPQLLDQ